MTSAEVAQRLMGAKFVRLESGTHTIDFIAVQVVDEAVISEITFEDRTTIDISADTHPTGSILSVGGNRIVITSGVIYAYQR